MGKGVRKIMACSLEERKAIKEAAKIEYNRLKGLLDQGYEEDEVNGIADIQIALDNMAAIVNEKPEKFKDQGELIDQSTILEINLNNPRVAGKPIEIISGTRYENGKVTYKVKYPNGDRVYNIGSARMSADQVDPTEFGRYGSESGVDAKITKDHERLKDEIWRDQTAAIKLFDELAELDSTLDEQHKNELRELLEQITDPQKQVLNEFKVYINRKAEKNGGAAVMYSGKDYLVLNVAESSHSKQHMSAAEVYVHEMVHMSVEMARKYESGPLASVVSDLNKLYEQAAKEIKINDLVVDGDMKQAERLWDYMFNNEDGISEFIAYGLTHKKLKEKLAEMQVKIRDGKKPETMLQYITAAIIKLWDTVRSLVNKNPESMHGDERLAKLVADLWEHNNTSIEDVTLYAKMKAKAESARAYVDDKLIKVGTKSVDVLSKVYDKTVDVTRDVPGLGRAVRFVGTTAKFVSPFTDKVTTEAIAEVAREMELKFEDMGFGRLFRQDGTVQKVLNYWKRDDNEVTWIEKLGLISQNIDRHRTNVIAGIGGELQAALKGTSENEQRMLTEVMLDLDTRVLFEHYKYDEVKDMIKDDDKLNDAIERETRKLRSLVKTDMVYNYYKAQSKGLGHYLATHVSGSSLNRSARHIVEMRGTGQDDLAKNDPLVKENRQEIVKTVDRLATLEGLVKTNKASKDKVAKLMDTHKAGIEKITAFHNTYVLLNADYKRENEIYTPTVKGEVKDLKVGWVDYIVAPNKPDDIKKMKKRGFRYKGETAVHGMGMYTTMTAGMQKFEKGAAAKINPDKELHNVMGAETFLQEDVDIGHKQGKKKVTNIYDMATKDVKKQMLGASMPTMDGYIAMMEGNYIVNYGISAEKNAYAEAVKQDRKSPVLLAKMLGEVQEKKEAIAINRVVLKEIVKDMKVNYRRGDEFGAKNKREYIEIGIDAKPIGAGAKEYSDSIWRDMPHSIKAEIMKKPKGQRFIAVRRDMAAAYFGRRAPSVLNIKVPFMDETIAQIANRNGYEYIVEYAKLAGDIWEEMIKILKIDTVIKTPKILIDNIMSNIYLQSVLGQMPWDAIKGQIEMFKATKEYLGMEREKLQLDIKIKSGKATLEDKAKMKRLIGMMKSSPVYDTMQAGLFTGIIDEVSLDGLQSSSRSEELVKKYTGWIPEIVKDAGSALYIGKDTWMFKSLQMVLQYSDFVMRTSRYHYLVKQGVEKNVALKMVTDEAVNYNRDLGGSMQWLKAMGFWQFFHYFLGANKNLFEKMRTRPSAVLIMEMSSMSNPTDAAFWHKNFGATMYGPVDLAFDKTIDYLENPALLRMFGFSGF